MYSECFYLAGLKDMKELNVQNSTLRANEWGRNFL
jgi:hypothetical protein